MSRYAQNMLWARPYVKAVAKLVPTKRVTVFRGYTVPPNVQPTTDASIIVHFPSREVSINVMLSGTRVECGQRRPVTLEIALLSLAHELAHLRHWDHTPEHMQLMSKIFYQFARVTKRERVKDTSRRLKRIRVAA